MQIIFFQAESGLKAEVTQITASVLAHWLLQPWGMPEQLWNSPRWQQRQPVPSRAKVAAADGDPVAAEILDEVVIQDRLTEGAAQTREARGYEAEALIKSRSCSRSQSFSFFKFKASARLLSLLSSSKAWASASLLLLNPRLRTHAQCIPAWYFMYPFD